MAKGITQTDRFVLFWGGWPSQWHPASFTLDGIQYNCCEQYMMAEKARVFRDDDALAHILACTNPRDQKAAGRKVKGFDAQVWDSVCRGIVYTGNLARFSQDPSLKSQLLDTGDRTIVEASQVDCIWGIGLAQDDPRSLDPALWRGKNWLGIALMQVRDTLARARGDELSEPRDVELLEQLETRAAMLW